MRRILATALLTALAATSAHAHSGIALRDMGAFHVGGWHVEVKGQPIKEVVFTPGGVPAKVDMSDVGIKGNSYMVMMDRNSGQVADLIQKCLVRQGGGRN